MEITLRLASQADVPAVMDIMTAARAAMADPSQYITDPEDYVRRHISREGFIYLALADGVPAGFFMTVLPGHIVGNTGYQLDFPPEILARTGILDSVAVHPAFQGHGIMARLLPVCLDHLASGCDTFAATVAPDNGPSLHQFQRCGFRPLRTIVKPGGQTRYLMVLDRTGTLFPSDGG